MYLAMNVFTVLAITAILVKYADCLSQEEVGQCLGAHNKLRALHVDTPPLEWDDSIAAKAQQYAEKLLAMHVGQTRTNLIHDTSTPGLGENIYWSDNQKPGTCPAASLSWYREIYDYDYRTADTKNGKAVGHFTQLIWKDTLKFGVGIAVGKSRYYAQYGNVETFVVAKYSPQGNFYWRGRRLQDYSRNVKPLRPGAVTPTLSELSETNGAMKVVDAGGCVNQYPDSKCGGYLKLGYKCGGKYKEFFKKNCEKTCGFC